MRIGVMQPYILPYVGYFQLINSVDKFVFYDDVNFIKGGWINRNQILSKNGKQLFSIPLEKASSFSQINQVLVHEGMYDNWKSKFYKSLNQTYGRAPMFNCVYPLILQIFDKGLVRVSELNIYSIEFVMRYLGLDFNYSVSSLDYPTTKDLERSDRIIKICELSSAKIYINPIGGQELYKKKYFENRNVELKFIQNQITTYNQYGESFVSGLSIIDVLMFNSKDTVKQMLNNFQLV